jgi:hypothetical protein
MMYMHCHRVEGSQTLACEPSGVTYVYLKGVLQNVCNDIFLDEVLFDPFHIVLEISRSKMYILLRFVVHSTFKMSVVWLVTLYSTEVRS